MEVHGENAEVSVWARKNVLKNQLLFLLTKMSEMCNHLSLGAKYNDYIRFGASVPLEHDTGY